MENDNYSAFKDNYLNYPRLCQFYNKIKTIFITKNELSSIKGDKGDRGEQGISVAKVEQTTYSNVDGGTNVITITLSDGATSDFNIKNGSKGSTGAKGDKGDPGTNATITTVATTSANGLMAKDMVTRLNIVTSEIIQSTEPTTQKKGDCWLQEY